MNEAERQAYLSRLTDEDILHQSYDWTFWARDEQLPPPGDWLHWAIIAGRGFGKTRTLAEWVRLKKDAVGQIAIIAATAADARDVIVDGISGILATSPPWDRPRYEPSKRRLTWANGAMAILYSGDEPDQLRGPQFGAAAIDELAKMRYAQDVWDQLKFTMRNPGVTPQILIATTPRPIPILKKILKHEKTVITTGSTFANQANLSASFLEEMLSEYGGTTLGQQELYAAILDEARGALWKRAVIEATRVGGLGPDGQMKPEPAYRETVIGVDPQTAMKRNETGIVAVAKGYDGHGYIRADVSGRYQPAEWAKKAVDLFQTLGASEIVAEGNQGGEMVRHTIHTENKDVPVRIVHARHSKQARAEPISRRYEQGLFHHVGMFSVLEDQMVTWEPESGDESPDRIDALVWAATRLFIGNKDPVPSSGPRIIGG